MTLVAHVETTFANISVSTGTPSAVVGYGLDICRQRTTASWSRLRTFVMPLSSERPYYKFPLVDVVGRMFCISRSSIPSPRLIFGRFLFFDLIQIRPAGSFVDSALIPPRHRASEQLADATRRTMTRSRLAR